MADFNKITDRVFKATQKQIDKFGPREAGSQAGRDCADYMHDDMTSFADDVKSQDFAVHTGAFMGWIRMCVASYIIGLVLLWMNLPFFSGIFLLVGLLIMVFEFFFYKHFVDFLYPKKTGRNVMGIVEPEGEVKQQIIISGHHDSAHIFNFFIHQPKLYALRVMGGIGFLVAICVLSFAASIVSAGWFTTSVAVLASIGALIVVQLWFYANKKCTPGAGDNLIASNMAVEALREFAKDKKTGRGLKNTRIIALSFDAEEEGLRGAYAFAKQNKELIAEAETYLFNVDCPYYLNEMFFLTSDINASVQLSEDFAVKCKDAAEKLGYKAVAKPITFLTGGTDAGEMAKAGVRATTMMAMPWDNSERAAVYHTPNDTCDAVEHQAVKAGLEVFFEVVKDMDKE